MQFTRNTEQKSNNIVGSKQNPQKKINAKTGFNQNRANLCHNQE